jgi:hypothetical protein
MSEDPTMQRPTHHLAHHNHQPRTVGGWEGCSPSRRFEGAREQLLVEQASWTRNREGVTGKTIRILHTAAVNPPIGL